MNRSQQINHTAPWEGSWLGPGGLCPREKEGPPVCRETKAYIPVTEEKRISGFCELINYRMTQCCGYSDQGDKKEEKVGKMPPVGSCWSRSGQEDLGRRGRTDGYTVGPTVAHSWELGP